MKSIVKKDSKEISMIKDFSFNFFVSIYFALVGIQLDVINNFSLFRFLMFFLIVFGLEFIVVITLLFTKLKKSTIINLGITMNARRCPGIVLATTAFAYNIINVEFFVLIILTMISSALVGYWLRYVKVKNENVFNGL